LSYRGRYAIVLRTIKGGKSIPLVMFPIR